MPVQEFINHIRYERRFSGHTVDAYKNDLDQFTKFIFDVYQITDPSQAGHFYIRSWVIDLIDKGISSRSVNRKLSTLRSYYRFLLKEGKVRSNPLDRVIPPKSSRQLPYFVEEEKIDLLLDQVDFGEGYEGMRDKMIIELFYATGMRLSELVNLKATDFNFRDQTIKVLGKRNKERLIPFNNMLGQSLRKYLEIKQNQFAGQEVREFMFVSVKGKKLYPRLVYRIVNKYLQKVTTLRKKSPHILRHTFATHMLNHGADLNSIKELLGHANLSATEVYTHNTIGKLKSIHQTAHPREKQTKED